MRVSLACFGKVADPARLDRGPVSNINSDLTAGTLDFTIVNRLFENLNIAFMGDTKGGAFEISGEIARAWLRLPINPNGCSNSLVLRPWRNGQDISRRPSDKWIIDFGSEISEQEASFFEAPFHHVKEHVRPQQSMNRRDTYRVNWWRHVEPRPQLRNKSHKLARYLATPRVSKHRVFVWLHPAVLPDSRIFAFVRWDCVIRRKAAGSSDAKRPVVRRKAATNSDGSRPPIPMQSGRPVRVV